MNEPYSDVPTRSRVERPIPPSREARARAAADRAFERALAPSHERRRRCSIALLSLAVCALLLALVPWGIDALAPGREPPDTGHRLWVGETAPTPAGDFVVTSIADDGEGTVCVDISGLPAATSGENWTEAPASHPDSAGRPRLGVVLAGGQVETDSEWTSLSGTPFDSGAAWSGTACFEVGDLRMRTWVVWLDTASDDGRLAHSWRERG